MNPAGRVLPAPSDPLFALVAYLLVIVALVGVLATSRTPQQRAVRLLFLYLAYGTFEIAVKRFTHFAWYVYPIKFTLFFLAVATWWAARPSLKARRFTPPLALVLSGYIALAALQIFNPNQPNPFVGVLGWMTDFMYLVLYFVAFDLLREERDVERLLWLTAALGVLSSVACMAESWIGAEQLQLQYPTFVPLLIFTDDGGVLYRPTSLVPYIEIFGVAAMVALIAMKRHRVALLLGGIGVCVFASLLHAVRITWVSAVLFVGLFTLLEWRKSWMGALAVAGCVFVAIGQFGLTEGVSARFDTLTTPIQTFQTNRLGGLVAVSRVVRDYPLGLGVGEGGPGLRFIGAAGGPTRLGTHNYLTDLAGQLSIIGPLLFLTFGFGIGLLGWRTLRRRDIPAGRRVMLRASLALFGAILIMFFGGGALGAYPENEYFWLLAGVIARFSLPAADLRLAARRPRMVRGVPLRRGAVMSGTAPGRRVAR